MCYTATITQYVAIIVKDMATSKCNNCPFITKVLKNAQEVYNKVVEGGA